MPGISCLLPGISGPACTSTLLWVHLQWEGLHHPHFCLNVPVLPDFWHYLPAWCWGPALLPACLPFWGLHATALATAAWVSLTLECLLDSHCHHILL